MRGPAYMLLGIGLFGLLDAISKLLSADHAVWQVLLVRFATMLAALLAIRAIRPGWGGALSTRRPGIHLLRACAMLGSAAFFFLTFSLLPLVEGYLVFFTAPFFVLGLAALILKERPRPAAWGWVVLGFAGVAIGLAPGLAAATGGSAMGFVWAICGTLCYSLVFVLNRSLRQEAGLARVVLWPALLGFLVMLGPGIATWRTPDTLALVLMIANGLIVGAATAALAEAFRHASASRLAPYGYSGLVWSVAFDLALWGHLPGWPMLVGAVIVVLACVMSERSATRA